MERGMLPAGWLETIFKNFLHLFSSGDGCGGGGGGVGVEGWIEKYFEKQCSTQS